MIPLVGAPLGTHLTVVGTPPPGPVAQRLARTGIRAGATITVLSRTAGGGRVVSVAGSRLALGDAVLRQILVAEVTG